MKISVTVLTKNSEAYLEEVLQSTTSFDEVILYDSGSEDRTLEIAKSFSNVQVHEGPFEGFGVVHNRVSGLASNDWILSIDSDEVLTPELVEEIQALQLDPKKGYSIWRKNLIEGKWIWHSGWAPDRVVRLYNRKETRFTDAAVHEAVKMEGLEAVSLQHPLLHYPYRDSADFMRKMKLYAELFAKENVGKKRSSFLKALSRSAFTLFKTLILKKGIFGGKWGWHIAIYNAATTYFKYMLLLELNNAQAPACVPKRTPSLSTPHASPKCDPSP